MAAGTTVLAQRAVSDAEAAAILGRFIESQKKREQKLQAMEAAQAAHAARVPDEVADLLLHLHASLEGRPYVAPVHEDDETAAEGEAGADAMRDEERTGSR
jgi:hypothetical protein